MFTTFTTTLHHSHHHRTCLQTNRRCWIEIPRNPTLETPFRLPGQFSFTLSQYNNGPLEMVVESIYILPNHCFYVTEIKKKKQFILNLPRQKLTSGIIFLGSLFFGGGFGLSVVQIVGKENLVPNISCWSAIALRLHKISGVSNQQKLSAEIPKIHPRKKTTPRD